jgi:phytanoyl-CoA hydroxylase
VSQIFKNANRSAGANGDASFSDLQLQFFRDNGFVLVKQIIDSKELQQLCGETSHLIDQAKTGYDDPDYYRARHECSGAVVPYRIEYIVDKLQSCKALLAHPDVLHTISCLEGPNFIPTWDSLVFKLDGAGVGHAWHRDAAPYSEPEVDVTSAAVDAGIYLDRTDLTNCLWVIPGSHRWKNQTAETKADELGNGGFDSDIAIPILAEPGDAIFHNIHTLHGSPESVSALRRVIYFEFRQVSAELGFGPHTPEYVVLKQQMLSGCKAFRLSKESQSKVELPRPAETYDTECLQPISYRYPHEKFWRYHIPFKE